MGFRGWGLGFGEFGEFGEFREFREFRAYGRFLLCRGL